MMALNPPTVSIRPYQPNDRHGCLAIFLSNVPAYFAPAEQPDFEAYLDQPPSNHVVVIRDNRLLACGGWYVHEGVGRLSWGMVMQTHHRASLGLVLLSWRLRQLFRLPNIDEVHLETSQHSAGFFKRCGFETVRTTPDGYGPGLHQVDMVLHREHWRHHAVDSIHTEAGSLDSLSESEIESLWFQEAAHRAAEMDQGLSKRIPAEEVRQQANALLKYR